MKKKIIMKLAALFMTGVLAVEGACAGIDGNSVYAAEADTVDSEFDGADSEFTGASGTGWVLDADGLLTITGDPEYEKFENYYTRPEWYNYHEIITKVEVGAFKAKSTKFWFDNCKRIKSISFADGFDTSNVTEMGAMFRGCSGLTSLDLNCFDTSKVSNMDYMFSGCNSLTSLDLSGFDTSNITYMGIMFQYCSSLTSLDLSGWDTSNVKDMNSMFISCSSLTSLNLSSFDTSNVIDMREMFAGCSGLTSLNLSGWDTSNVTDMFSMFSGCSDLTSLDLSGFDTSNVICMVGMFSDCSGLTSLDLSNFDTSKVKEMNGMFNGCSGLTTLDVSSFDTSNVTDMSHMFCSCSSLTSLDVSGFDTSKVTAMGTMFQFCSSLTSLDLRGFDTSNVKDMRDMFYSCSSLTSLDLSSWDTSKVTDMLSMFGQCEYLTTLDVRGFNTSNITDMSQMFFNCLRLKSLDLSSFDTSNVTDMSSMFDGCRSLTSLNVSGFDTSKVTDMRGMFQYCFCLTSLDVSGWDTSNVTNMICMFSYCSDLTSIDVSGWDTSDVQDINDYGLFSSCDRIESIKPFVGFTGNMELPLEKMYDISGTAYTSFPQGLTEPITLYASKPTTSSATSVTMKKKVLNIDTEKRYKLSYTYAPRNCTDEPVWTSSDSSVVSVNSVGMITSHSKVGTAVITVSLGSYSDSCEVTVRKAVTPDETYRIIFDANGGSGSMGPLTATIGKEITLCQNTFVKTDYTFAGWCTSVYGLGTRYTDKAKVKDLAPANGSITLYAQWKKNTPEPTEITQDTPTVTPTATTIATATPIPTSAVSGPTISENNADIPNVTPTLTVTSTPTSTVSDPSASENNADISIVTPTPTPTPTPIPDSANGDTISTKSISGLPKGAQTLDAGGSVNLNPVVKTADGENSSATWLAPVGHVLDAVSGEDGSLDIKAVGPGTAYVTIVSGTKTKTVKYNVKQSVKKVDTSINSITLGVNEKYRLCVTPDAATTDKFYFESSDKNICSVDQKGLIKAKKTEGSATITIYAYDKKSDKKNRPVASVDVKVESKEAAEVSVTDASINYLGNKELYVGEMGYISTLINGGANNGGAAVKYTMDNKGIVKIDSYGHVTAKKAGTVTITATCGEKTDSVTLTVKQPLKLYKVNKSYVKVAAPKAGKSSKKVTVTVKTNPTAKKFIDGGGKVTWTVTSKDTGISLKSDDGKGKAVFEVPSGASDTIVTATISDPVTGKTYSTDCMIDVK